MFTSRAEYRLLLRQDNADLRLMEKGYTAGLITRKQYKAFTERKRLIEEELTRLAKTKLKPQIINPVLKKNGGSTVKESVTLYHLLKRPEIKYLHLAQISPPDIELPEDVINQVEIQVKYKGYIKRQAEQAEKFKKIEEKLIPDKFNYKNIQGLSREIVEKLEEVRPLNLGQAGRIPGVTPAAIALLMVAVAKEKRK